MVHRGPSTGCQKCRARHIKCDEQRPACKRCVSQGHVCPGYEAVGGIRFKDLTQQVSDKQIRRAERGKTAILRVMMESQKLCLEPPVASICFFYRQYIVPASRDPSPTTGFFQHIMPLYRSAEPTSALNMAVSVMASRAMSLYHGQPPTSPRHLQMELAAAQAIRAAISDPLETVKDETLLAVLCVGFTRFLEDRAAIGEDARIHLEGALALIRYRKPGSFGSKLSQSLLAATRSHVLLQSLWFPEDVESQDLVLSLPDIEPRDGNPAVSIHYLLARVLSLERQMLADRLSGTGGFRDQSRPWMSKAQVLCEELVSWRRDVPADWEHVTFPPRTDAKTSMPDTYEPVEVAYVFGQWHCTYLLALKLAFVTLGRDDAADETSIAIKKLDILFIVQRIVDSLLFSVLPLFDQADTAHFSQVGPRGATLELESVSMVTTETSGVLPPHRRPYLSNLLTWALATLTEDMDGADGFCVRPATLEHLVTWRQIVAGEG